MLIRRFDRSALDSEPEKVLYKDIYPWDEIEDTPFGASLAIIEPGGQTMLHSHDPDETFIIFQGSGTISVDEETNPISQGDVVVMPSGSQHTLKNESESEPLMFLSLFWWGDDTDTHSYHMFGEDEEQETQVAPPRLIFPSPPTSNGPLHVGHLAGPYIMADVIRRFDALNGRPNSVFLCLTDDHQSYTLSQAEDEGKSVEEVCQTYSNHIRTCLKQCLAEPDHSISPSRDQDYKNAVQAAFKKLFDIGFITSEEQDVFHCNTCDRGLFDGHVVGGCPHCDANSLGFACESCCLPNRTVDLRDPVCTKCEQTPEIQKGTRLAMDLEPARAALKQYHEYLNLTPKLRRLSSQYLAMKNLKVPAAVPSSWGIPVPMEGFDGLVISPWLEIALANHHLRERVGEHESVTHTFGYDNSFCYLMSDPAVSLALDQNVRLASELVVNEYLSLNDVKMSTSKGHYLSPDILLTKMPIDLLRFYLATVRPEVSETSCSLRNMADTVNGLLIGRWQDWLASLGETVTQEFVSSAPEFEEWNSDHTLFMAELTDVSNKARMGYENRRLQIVSKAAIDLVNKAMMFGHEQSHLAGLPDYAEHRATSVALELAAARLLAVITYPIMPTFGAQLWKVLGHRHPMEEEGWSKQVRFLPPGQRILARAGLCGRRLFPEPVNLDEMIEAE
jgi:methionyl-tRNA synthetase